MEGTLYLSTPFNQVIALDPATGVARWTYDPKVDRAHGYSEVTSRGVAAWSDSKSAEGSPCKLRIFEGTIDARLIALDGKTGKQCAGFGSAGTVDLTRGVVYGPEFRGDYQVTSAPAVVGDVIITGSSIGDNGAVDMPRGVVRGYDARTGALRWTWDPIPWAEKQQVRTGAATAWSTIAADPAHDLVFIPTVFVLDRATGKPMHTVEERAVPKSDVAGEAASASQPVPAWSAMVPQRLTADDVGGATPEAREWCRQKLMTLRNDGLFAPPSVRGSIALPGNIGGVNWGSAAWDPVRNLLVANTNRVAAIFQVIPREDMQSAFDHAKETETSWGGEFARQRGTPYGMHRE